MDMKTLVKVIVAAAALILPAAVSNAQESPLWLRMNSISPDGKSIAFSYKGDIFTVPADGGKALQITSNKAYESDPMWTPDGKKIVFTSYREDSKDIFVTSAQGGTPVRLTDMPGSETPLAVLPSGTVFFIWYNGEMGGTSFDGFPGDPQLYKVSLEGGAPRLASPMTFAAISANASGDLLYEDYKGYEDPLRKHHTSSVTRDIWLYRPAAKTADGTPVIDSKGSFTKLSTYKGEDRNPVFAADGDTFWFLSEQDGKTSNVYRSSLSSPSTQVQLTFETKNPVRFLSASSDGTLAYSYNGELYTLKEGQSPKKVEITLSRDEDEREKVDLALRAGASSMAVSPDGKEIAIVVRGDVFVTAAGYPTTRRITNTAGQERNVCFSKDGREIYYSAERDGCWGIYKTSLKRKEDKLFTYAVDTEETLVSTKGETCFQPEVSPDGKLIAYYRDRTTLVVKDLKSGKEQAFLEGVNYSYSDGDQSFKWSPDSRYILCNYQGNGGWNNEDIALIDLEKGTVTDLTESGYSDGGFKWALGGKAMVFESDKNGYRSHGSWGAQDDIYIMFFDGKAFNSFTRSKEQEEIAKLFDPEEKKDAKKEAKDSTKAEEKKPEKLTLDLEARHDRILRLTPTSNRIGDHFLTPDGKKLFFTQQLEKGFDLCVKDIQEGSITVVKKGVTGRLVPSKDGKSIYIFSGSSIVKYPVAGGKQETITFSGEFEFKAKEERAYIFEHCWKQVKEKFYVEDLHGIDWDYYHENYAKFLPYINNNYDFKDLLSEMLGELNGSHTGGRFRSPSSRTMGHLGVIYDTSYEGDGLKIAEVLPGGVLSNTDSEIKPGDIITSIEGTELKAGSNPLEPLYNKAGKKIAISIKTGNKTKDLIVTPAATDAGPLYRRWVRRREEMVKELSDGKVGYVHIQGMDSPSFRELYSKALGKYRNCEALIVDTRHNGGGWLHDDLVTFLGGKEYCLFTPRGQYIGHEPFNKWTKPSCVLMGEDNYSDACGFPYAYRSLGLGKLIGAPVPGTMTAVWWETQVNATIVFGIPQVGNWGVKDGRYIENFQIEPDIAVYNDPASTLDGKDLQLEAAVAEMLKEIEKK